MNVCLAVVTVKLGGIANGLLYRLGLLLEGLEGTSSS